MDNKANHNITLRDYFEQRFNAMDKALDVAMESMNKRLDSMNEFRASLKDQSQTMMTRPECAILHKKVDDDLQRKDNDIRLLRESKATLEGKASQLSMNITLLVALISLVISVISMLR